MKHALRYLLFLFPLTIHAQNWEIFNSYDRYNYQASGAPLITNVLFADSFHVAGNDTIYYLNRIVQKPNYIASYDTVLKNLPQFFQKQIRRSTDGTYIFGIDSGYDGFNPDTFTIKAFANVGDNWLYDTTANITATVASNVLQILFGTTDSVKQINLSNGDSILLSKSFGIVGFPSDTLTSTGQTPVYYNLSGIETRGIGDSVINFWSIYNFNVGDVFMYEEDDEGGGGGPDNGDIIKYKYTILSKLVYPDSISYTAHELYYEYDYGQSNTDITTAVNNITLTFADSAAHFANTYPGQFVPLAYEFFSVKSSTYSNYVMSPGPQINLPYYQLPLYNLPCKHSNDIFDSINNNVMTMFFPGGFGSNLTCYVCAGIGDTYMDEDGPESESTVQLIGYIKNGVQTGTVLTDGEILGISGVTPNTPAISLYPNLTADYTYVHLSNLSTNGALHFTVYDLTGRVVLNQPLTNNRTKIDCNNLPSAVYVWRVMDENENVVGAGKLVKQ